MLRRLWPKRRCSTQALQASAAGASAPGPARPRLSLSLEHRPPLVVQPSLASLAPRADALRRGPRVTEARGHWYLPHCRRPPDVGEDIRTPEYRRAADDGPVERPPSTAGGRWWQAAAPGAALSGRDGMAPAVHHGEVLTQVVIDHTARTLRSSHQPYPPMS